MPELAHPTWLVGLLLVPWIRWLHRLHAPGQPRRVPALFLWRDAVAAVAAGRRLGPPDPAWRHRAVLAALAVLALAGPAWTGSRALETLAGVPFARVIPLGAAAANQAVVGLALRPSLTDPDRLRGLVEVWGSGADAGPRTLALRLDDTMLEEVELDVPGDGGITHAFTVPRLPEGRLTAQLEPRATDALPLDDELSLDLAGASPRATVVADGACNPVLKTALSAHPGLRAATGAPDLRVDCGAAPPPGETPTLWVVRGEAGEELGEPPVWLVDPAAAAPRLEAEWLHPVSPPVPLEGRVLLGSSGLPLILDQAEPRRIVLMFEINALEDRPELPVLVGLLLDRLAGRDLLMPVARVGRDLADVRVAPAPLPEARPDTATPADRIDASPWLIVGALGVALYDLGRRARAVLAA